MLHDVDLAVDRGEVVVVIGPSGSGKSTLCRTINRLESISSGTITFDGRPLPAEGKALAKLRSEVGMVFQSFNSSRTKRRWKTSTSRRWGAQKEADAPRPHGATQQGGHRDKAAKIPLSSPAGSSSGWPSRGRSLWRPR